jgi:hypothetical protein
VIARPGEWWGWQVAFSPDGKTAAATVLNGKKLAVKLWDVDSGKTT